jgi:hypothetical protein
MVGAGELVYTFVVGDKVYTDATRFITCYYNPRVTLQVCLLYKGDI